MGVISTGNAGSVDYLKGCNPSNCIPENTSISEMAYYVVEANEAAFTDLTMSIGINELGILESTGQEIVYEGANLKELISRAKEAVRKIWTNIQDLYDKAIKAVQKKCDDFKKNLFAKVDQNKLRDKINAMPNDKKISKGYEYKHLQDGDCGKIITGLGNAAEKACDICRVACMQDDDLSTIDSDFAVELNRPFAGISDVKGDLEVSKLKAQLKSYMLGKEITIDGKYMKSNWATMLKETKNGVDALRSFKNTYNSTKKGVNGILKKVDKEFDGSDPGKYIAKETKCVTKVLNVMTVVDSAIIECYNKELANYRTALLKVVASRPVKESFEVEVDESYATTEDRIASLFEW